MRVPLARLLVLDVAAVALALAMFSHSWAGVPEAQGYRSRMSSVAVGLRNFETSLGSELRTKPLRELNGKGIGFEHSGKAALIIGLVAVMALIAGGILLKKPRTLALRIGLCAPLAASLIASVAFVVALDELKYLKIGWAAWAAIVSASAGCVALMWPTRVHRDVTNA